MELVKAWRRRKRLNRRREGYQKIKENRGDIWRIQEGKNETGNETISHLKLLVSNFRIASFQFPATILNIALLIEVDIKGHSFALSSLILIHTCSVLVYSKVFFVFSRKYMMHHPSLS